MKNLIISLLFFAVAFGIMPCQVQAQQMNGSRVNHSKIPSSDDNNK